MAVAEENQIVQVVLPRQRVKDIDALAREQQRTRSAYLQLLILECLTKKQADPHPCAEQVAA